jgi:hypothetical protein
MNDADAKFDDRNGRPVGSREEEERTTSQPLKGNYVPDAFATDALDETHLLLAYAASSGINIDQEVSDAIARARAANERHSWDADIESKFWPAKSKLSLSVKPVTVDSLAAGAVGAAAKATRRYFVWTLILSAIIVPISIVMFINTAVSNDVASLLRENDAAAIAVHEQLVNYESAAKQATRTTGDPANQNGNPANLPGVSEALLSPNLVEKLAQFARVSRQLFAEAQVLNFFILNAAQKPEWAGPCATDLADLAKLRQQCEDSGWEGPCDSGTAAVLHKQCEAIRRTNLELDVRAGDPARDPKKGNLLHRSITDQGFEKLGTYQDIRSFARQTQQMNLVIYGAVTAYVLPVAYALLGACAFALRNMAAQTGTKTYQPSYSNRARLIIAMIAGTVVGLFNNFTQGVSVSPLAVAFLVGYAVEVFFSFLDAFVHTFERVRNPRALGAPATA